VGATLLLGLLLSAADPSPSVRLWLGGDVSLGKNARALEGLRPLVAGRGAGVLNLEGPADPDPKDSDPRAIFNAPDTLEAERALGVVALGIANNHAGDRGPRGEAATLAAVRAHGMAAVGGGAGAAVITQGGVRVAITAHDLTHGVPVSLRQELQAARRGADLLVATFHVTGPPSYLPRPELRQAVELALQVGARAVIAHGSHLVGPIERRGDAVIAWGLGNVAFACACTDVTDGLLLALELGPGPPTVTLLPIDAGLRGAAAVPARDPAAIFDLLEALGTPHLQRHGGLATLP
jgi:hypothetical protein